MKLNVFLLFLLSFLCQSCTVSKSQSSSPSQVCITEYCYDVQIARTLDERMRGLQGRRMLRHNAGMLFVFETPGVEKFWMKDTLIPLDMIWLDENQQVIFIQAQVPPCQNDPCPIYGPDQPAKYVLELNAGEAEKLKMNKFDKIKILFGF